MSLGFVLCTKCRRDSDLKYFPPTTESLSVPDVLTRRVFGYVIL